MFICQILTKPPLASNKTSQYAPGVQIALFQTPPQDLAATSWHPAAVATSSISAITGFGQVTILCITDEH